MFMLLLIFEIVCGVFEWKQISTGFFIVCLYYVLTFGDPIIKRAGL
jgi:hypothetical protein